MVNLLSLAVPLAYITVLVGSLAVFSSLYRKRKAAKAAALEPWFDPHTPRDVYLSLLHLEGTDAVPENVIRAALLLRAKEDIRRVMVMRNSKQTVQQLLQRGSIGDDVWTRFQAAEAELDNELRDVVMEANAFQEGWGQLIFQTANEMFNHDRLRERARKAKELNDAERKWWNEKVARIQKELGVSEETSDSDGVLVEPLGEKTGTESADKKNGKSGKN